MCAIIDLCEAYVGMKHDLTYTSCLPGKERRKKNKREGGGGVAAERYAVWAKDYWHDLQRFVDILSLPTFSSSLMNYKKILTLDDFKPYTDKSRKMPLPFH